MPKLSLSVLSLMLLASANIMATEEQPTDAIIVTKSDAQAAVQGNSQNFTGDVTIDNPFRAEPPSRAYGATVSFEPGARTAWHTHPLGQLLIVTEGIGCVQSWGEPLQIIKAGDTVWIPADIKHWHGAAPDSAMTHVAIVESLNGQGVTWLERVSDEQYATANRQ
ncbi:(R)-mandelonitrile lyase [Cerasicoccus frondis]|uniref:(R)-mandelonitrile lyase n=1 Tax=Cerasicoccus frondis TaxID=490090 RepID=UPI0031B86AF5